MSLPLLIDEQGHLPLPWLADPLQSALDHHKGHALLVHGAAGVGALQFVLALAQSWLCEAPTPRPSVPASEPLRPSSSSSSAACGRCGSCRLVQARVHPDLFVLLPESLRREHDWPVSGDKTEGEDSKRKPSRQIRIVEVRAMLQWAYKTSARGRGKVAVLHPADVLNAQSANALLKTLEEPPDGTRLILSTTDPALLLPTLRSRCQHLRLAPPQTAQALQWLSDQGVSQASVLLAACSGRPLQALEWSQAGVNAAQWLNLPTAMRQGQAAALAGWPIPRAVDALQKLCHDAMACAAGAPPRFFSAESMPKAADVSRLAAWAQELARIARHDEHPWNEGLLIDSLVGAAAQALVSGRPPASFARTAPPDQGRAGTTRFDTLRP